MTRPLPRRLVFALATGLAATASTGLVAQPAQPGLVVPAPPADSVEVRADSFVTASGARRRIDVYRPRGAAGALPVVVFVNAVAPQLREWRGYVEWARLVTRRGVAGVLYEAQGATAAADLAALLDALGARGAALGVDGANVVLWAASANGAVGTPAALDARNRAVRGYVLYYGVGDAGASPRLDVPVLVARAGLDAPPLNRGLDALVARLVGAGVPLTLVNHAAGRHGFDLFDDTPATAAVVAQTLDFIAATADRRVQTAIADGAREARGAAALHGERWSEAIAVYRDLVRERAPSTHLYLQLGRALLGGGEPAAALDALDRAGALGPAGPRDLGYPGARAARRAGQRARAVEWLRWAITNGPPQLRQEIAADAELAPLLPEVGTTPPS